MIFIIILKADLGSGRNFAGGERAITATTEFMVKLRAKATAWVFIMISPVDRESKSLRGDVISIPHVCFCRPSTFLIKFPREQAKVIIIFIIIIASCLFAHDFIAWSSVWTLLGFFNNTTLGDSLLMAEIDIKLICNQMRLHRPRLLAKSPVFEVIWVQDLCLKLPEFKTERFQTAPLRRLGCTR